MDAHPAFGAVDGECHGEEEDERREHPDDDDNGLTLISDGGFYDIK